ncbi:MAG: Rpn family recombination-promoting nuclease/putative transposase [Microcoleus sp. PH2017_01_SCD_O_A]|uniref:Rpn family recombination-promoting nuclease/putative transposase n=1 Tax=unclassified Microcoleus TaxID=2642155 RepID=UPI001DF6713D|nr:MULTISPECIES: Rpn family recombination-promoting nuclease/putative transposase [unclassified Microcoleus]TAF87140.1 MAG: Rpn family recombination-promoting nuclease/putative transposase [Oscillatoriales cyanobacterium]MCC3424353.1 Rpn family recombination-promoting nuclease/putative transposase [Microcoleus sp. PH2017_01_SCD_O_A]MCC3450430.1 Rpn family recombination-promoting nuclease/putative transposase [Microcoleus sp. PH2017_09_SFU_O_A]MCC3631329.1 Rpn family recombination-promoting nucl
MKTDTIFYSLFQEFPSFFFELIDRPPEEAAAYEFTSREIKQLAFRIDGLFLPTTEAPEKPFYLAEVQFQPDPDLYYRIFGELFLYLRQYKPVNPWRVVVIYPSRRIEHEQMLQFQELLTSQRVQRIYLDELPEAADRSLGVKIVKLVIEPAETAAEQARQSIAMARQQLSDPSVLRDLINLIETIIVYKLPQKSREEIATMLNLSELRQTRFYQEVKQEGLEEGLEQGGQQAKLEAIRRMIAFGMNLETIAQLLDLSLEFVRQTIHKIQRESMSLPEQKIDSLIELLNQQRSLFSAAQLTELAQLIESLSDESDVLSEAISSWAENYSSIQEAQSKLLEPLPPIAKTSETAAVSPESSESEIGDRPNKQALKNAILL